MTIWAPLIPIVTKMDLFVIFWKFPPPFTKFHSPAPMMSFPNQFVPAGSVSEITLYFTNILVAKSKHFCLKNENLQISCFFLIYFQWYSYYHCETWASNPICSRIMCLSAIQLPLNTAHLKFLTGGIRVACSIQGPPSFQGSLHPKLATGPPVT